MMQFIDGVTLIEMTERRELSLIGMILIGAILLFAIACFVWDAIKSFKEKKDGVASSVGLALAICVVFGICLASYFNVTPQYVVQVDDNVSINEFTENYTIVSNVNDKYVIEMKDEASN